MVGAGSRHVRAPAVANRTDRRCALLLNDTYDLVTDSISKQATVSRAPVALQRMYDVHSAGLLYCVWRVAPWIWTLRVIMAAPANRLYSTMATARI